MGYGAAVGDYDGDGDLDVYVLNGRGHPNALFRNEHSAGRQGFVDVTATSGVDLADLGGSRVAHFVDLDNDGDLDLLVVNDQGETQQYPPSRIYENVGGGQFTDKTATAGFSPVGFGLFGCSLADYDRDGLLDVYVSAWTNELGNGNWLAVGRERTDCIAISVASASSTRRSRLASRRSVRTSSRSRCVGMPSLRSSPT